MASGRSMALPGTILVEQEKAVNERSLESVPAGGRQSGGFVNRAVSHE